MYVIHFEKNPAGEASQNGAFWDAAGFRSFYKPTYTENERPLAQMMAERFTKMMGEPCVVSRAKVPVFPDFKSVRVDGNVRYAWKGTVLERGLHDATIKWPNGMVEQCQLEIDEFDNDEGGRYIDEWFIVTTHNGAHARMEFTDSQEDLLMVQDIQI